MARQTPAVMSIDWTACRGRGLCAELFPERIGLDEWGYPLIDATPVTADLAGHAARAVKTCPVRALRLRPAPAPPGPPNPPGRPPHRQERS